MSNFQNEFSWSPSRHRMFESCKRQYYFNYYGSWGGWDKNADAQSQLLYRLKKITTVPQLVGTVVHDAISNALNALKLGRDILPFAVETYAQNLFHQHLQESRDHLWRYSASQYTNLFEHYYNEPFTEADQINSANHISTSLNAFPMTTNTHLCTTCPFKAACYPDERPAKQPTPQSPPQQDPVQLSLF